MRILVLGGDGYLGWPTALHLSACGHEVAVNDNFARRGYDEEMGVESLVPIATLQERVAAWAEVGGKEISSYVGDLCDEAFVHQMVGDFQPETIVHFAEQRAAPYSMIDQAHAVYTQKNNVVGNLNVMYAIGDLNRGQRQSGVRVSYLGDARHRPQSGRRVRPGNRADQARPAAGHPL
jgi:UDP-sulfoquinovose synthase